jgi:hypothetical protein
MTVEAIKQLLKMLSPRFLLVHTQSLQHESLRPFDHYFSHVPAGIAVAIAQPEAQGHTS